MSVTQTVTTKKQLRVHYRAQLQAHGPAERAESSHRIIASLTNSSLYRNARTMFTYVSMPQEVDTMLLIKKALHDGKRIAVPRVEKGQILVHELHSIHQLELGAFGILQPPKDAPRIASIELALIPGLAFTTDGVRLGHGGGYFDRWLPTLPVQVPAIGLAFSWQLADKLPSEPHDFVVSQVLTD